MVVGGRRNAVDIKKNQKKMAKSYFEALWMEDYVLFVRRSRHCDGAAGSNPEAERLSFSLVCC
ncbi:MAG: hypothetical protein LBR10_04145 [Prevotellaceae bacterium]|nr:hypothetical protein [Prevotellaceae bacterium]